MVSKKPRKQRKRYYDAPIHKRRRQVSAHLGPSYLDDEKKAYPRSFPVRKGDTVLILRGEDKGREGKVASVDTKTRRITIEGVTIAKADGTQVAKKIHPSNVIITKLDLSDPWRRRKFEELGERK